MLISAPTIPDSVVPSATLSHKQTSSSLADNPFIHLINLIFTYYITRIGDFNRLIPRLHTNVSEVISTFSNGFHSYRSKSTRPYTIRPLLVF